MTEPDKRLGVCDTWLHPHPQGSRGDQPCSNWHPLEAPECGHIGDRWICIKPPGHGGLHVYELRREAQ